MGAIPMTATKTSWSLSEGLEVVRELQPYTRRYNYHLTLGGGVLNRGMSDKDLDLFFLPMDNGYDTHAKQLLWFLQRRFGPGESIWTDYSGDGSSCYSHKFKFVSDETGRRIDVFILRGE